MFRLDAVNVYRSELLESLPWVRYGFGTRLSVGWPDASNLATVRQVHSSHVVVADRAGELGEGDALITNQPGLALAVRTADCLPILIADPPNRAVAAIHAGWRGLVQGIVPESLRTMAKQFGSRPEELVVVVGPGIGPCCFEVGPEVAIQFTAFFPERKDLSGRTTIDLAATTLRQLRRNGGTLRQTASSGECTACRSDLFHSYRRDREKAGRMVSTIEIR